MNISWSITITNARMHARELTVDEFMAAFAPENVRTQPTKDGPNYIAGRLLDYSKPRGKGNIIDRCAAVLDCDDATPDQVKALCEAIKNLGVRSVVHSTYSSTPDNPRVRVVIPLNTAVVPGDYTALCKALMSHLNMVTWDKSCAQAERAMYMPAKPEGADNYWAEYADGPLMNGVEWLKAHAPAPKKRTSRGNVAKRDKRRKPKNDSGIAGAFNRVYTVPDAIEEFDLPYEPCADGRWTYYGSDSVGGLRLVEGREDLCISEHANTDPACFIDGNGSHRALSAFELCAIHLYGDSDDTSVAPRERASMQPMAKRAAEDEAVRAELGDNSAGSDDAADIAWLAANLDNTYRQARHVAEALRNRLAYVEGLGWVAYAPNRGVWVREHDSVALNFTAEVTQTWYEGAMLTGDTDLIKKVSRLQRMPVTSGIAKHLPRLLSIPVTKFDADPELLCAPNGIVDLRTGKLMPHDPKYLMMQQTRAPYVPSATHEAWDRALEAIREPEGSWFQVWIGCSLTGYQPDDYGAAVPILLGGGSNGKSVLMNAIARTFGGYAYMGVHALLAPKDGKALLQAAAPLCGKRLCYVEEFPDGVMNGNAIKQMSATPTIKGEYKYKTEFTFNATHSLMVSANVPPRLDECTDAVMRRVAVLPFDCKYVQNPDPKNPNEKLADHNLLRELQTPEAQAAILAWAVEGAKAYLAADHHVLPATKKMEEEKASWVGDVDTLGAFFDDMLVEEEGAKVSWTHLYAAFTTWQRDRGGSTWNKATLKARMSSHPVFSKFKSGKLRTSGMSMYSGKGSEGLRIPTGTQVAGMSGVRFRTDADDRAEAIEEEAVPVETAPAIEAVETAPLIDVEDIPAITHHVAPERDDVERGQLVEVINDLVDEVMCSPGGAEEVGRLAHETGAVSPATATLGQMRALKMRLENSLIYYYSHNMFPGAYTRMQE